MHHGHYCRSSPDMKGRKYVLHMKTPSILASEETKTRVSNLKRLRKRDLSCTHSPCPHSVRSVAKWRYQGSRYFGPLKKSWGIIWIGGSSRGYIVELRTNLLFLCELLNRLGLSEKPEHPMQPGTEWQWRQEGGKGCPASLWSVK